jgi:trigger factor
MANQMAQYGMELSTYLSLSNLTVEKMRENMRPNAEKQARYNLALETIAQLEGIDVGEDEIEEGYGEYAERYGAGIDEVRESVPKEVIKDELTAKKALKLITDNAVALPPEEGGDDAAAAGTDGAAADAGETEDAQESRQTAG